MSRILAIILLLSLTLALPRASGASTTEFYLHGGSCIGYPSPCIVFNDNLALGSSPASYTLNQINPVVYIGLTPSISASGLILNGGSYILRLNITDFTIDQLIDPSYLIIRAVRGSSILLNQSFIFNPSKGENDFVLNGIPSTSGAPSFYLSLNSTGSSITSLTLSFDSSGSPSRLSTPGFHYTGVPVFNSATILVTLAILGLTIRLAKRSPRP